MPVTVTKIEKSVIADLEKNIQTMLRKKEAFANKKKQYDYEMDILEREVLDLLKQCGMTRYVGKNGEALIIETTQRKWYLDKLEDTLTVRQFKLFCPPTPSGKILTAYRTTIALDGAATRKLDACCDLSTVTSVRVASPEEVEKRAKKPETETVTE